MRFIETPIFTRIATELWSDNEYHALQIAMVQQPRKGKVIPGSNGLRKIRWIKAGVGKRGGIRVIYSWDEASETFFMLYAHSKSKIEDLTPRQLQTLGDFVRKELK